MYALFYNGQLVGIITNPTAYGTPEEIKKNFSATNLCQMVEIPEGIQEMMEPEFENFIRHLELYVSDNHPEVMID